MELKEQKNRIILRLDDLMMEMNLLKIVNTKLYYKILPDMDNIKHKLRYFRKWIKNIYGG